MCANDGDARRSDHAHAFDERSRNPQLTREHLNDANDSDYQSCEDDMTHEIVHDAYQVGVVRSVRLDILGGGLHGELGFVLHMALKYLNSLNFINNGQII
jgi:hypothetical protein